MPLKINRRVAQLEDFLATKKFYPASKWRQKSKGINFASEFGATGPSIGAQLRDAYQFREEDCDEAIETLKLEDVYNQALAQSKGRQTPTDIKYNVVGSALRKGFFDSYPGLMRRIQREHKFAHKHGFVRTWVGPVRHLTELRFMKFSFTNDEFFPLGADAKLYKAKARHLDNDAANSTIQTAEVQHAMPDIVCIQWNLNRWGLKSAIYNYIHDSWEMFVYYKEKDLVYALCNKVGQIMREPCYYLPVFVDSEISDYTKGEYFKHGTEANIEKYDLDVELKKWNETYNMNLEFIDIVPFTEEGRRNLHKYYLKDVD